MDSPSDQLQGEVAHQAVGSVKLPQGWYYYYYSYYYPYHSYYSYCCGDKIRFCFSVILSDALRFFSFSSLSLFSLSLSIRFLFVVVVVAWELIYIFLSPFFSAQQQQKEPLAAPKTGATRGDGAVFPLSPPPCKRERAATDDLDPTSSGLVVVV